VLSLSSRGAEPAGLESAATHPTQLLGRFDALIFPEPRGESAP